MNNYEQFKEFSLEELKILYVALFQLKASDTILRGAVTRENEETLDNLCGDARKAMISKEENESNVFKIFIFRDGDYYSMINHGLSMKYYREEDNYPEVGYLLAFDSLENAIAYAEFLNITRMSGRLMDGYRICRCDAVIEDVGEMRVYQQSERREDMIRFWEMYPNYNPFYACSVPTGTVFCRNIRIIEDVTAGVQGEDRLKPLNDHERVL